MNVNNIIDESPTPLQEVQQLSFVDLGRNCSRANQHGLSLGSCEFCSIRKMLCSFYVDFFAVQRRPQ